MYEKKHDFVEEAFLQLSFAIKLWNFPDVHPIDKNEFDVEIKVIDKDSRICLPANQFKSYDDIKIASENNLSICFGIAANTLWEAIRKKNGLETGQLDPDVNGINSIASLVYVIRCCFAHGPAQPVWHITEKYKTQYRIRNKTIDLREVEDDMPFDYSRIDGHDTLWLLKKIALEEGFI